MKLDDALWGALFGLFGTAILVHVQGFPRIPGQNVGPALFPGLIGAALVVCGLILVIRGVLARRAAGAAPALPWAAWPEWIGERRSVVAFVVLIAVNLFYLLAVDRLGFLIVSVIYLTALMLVLRVRPVRAVVISVLMALAIHYAFYKLLKVPLPWGVLQGVAW